jgi:hypothetical protein
MLYALTFFNPQVLLLLLLLLLLLVVVVVVVVVVVKCDTTTYNYSWESTGSSWINPRKLKYLPQVF